MGFFYRGKFKTTKTFCLFLGYPRSGHSIVGALLDAHPEIIIAHESHALKYLHEGFTKNQIFYLLLRNSRIAAQKGRQSSGYSYQVKNQWQGKFTQLKIIGDKRGASTTSILMKHPELLEKLQNKINLKIKIIHVIRNPYDIITTRARRGNKKLLIPTKDDIDKMIETHFQSIETILKIKNSKKWEIFDMKHEDLINNPQKKLIELCNFMNIKVSKEYINKCSSIIYKTTHKSRFDINWTNNQIEKVKNKMTHFNFLKGYHYKS